MGLSYVETEHEGHLERRVYVETCAECRTDAEAIDWLLAVRRYGLAKANELFPGGPDAE